MTKGDFTTLGASAHSKEEREENDFYATDPKALELFLDQTGIELRNVWECACGEGHLAKVLDARGILGKATDLIDRGYGEVERNFFYSSDIWDGDILTNPPYGDAMKFCGHALDCVEYGSKVVMLMRIQFLEGQRRKPFLLASPPKYVYVSSSRLLLAKNADFVRYNTPSANCYAWYVWEKVLKEKQLYVGSIKSFMKKYKFINIKQVANELFENQPVYRIFNNKSSDQLGMLSYYKPWKEYVFSSTGNSVFNDGCMRDILNFMDTVIKKQKQK